MAFLDLEAVNRFVDTVSKNEEESVNRIAHKLATGQPVSQNERDEQILNDVSMADLRAAYLCLAVLVNTSADVRKLLGLKGKRGPKKKDSWIKQSTAQHSVL